MINAFLIEVREGKSKGQDSQQLKKKTYKIRLNKAFETKEVFPLWNLTQS